MQKYSLIVRGMRCSACSGAIEKLLNGIEGSSNVSVNLVTGMVSFFVPTKIDINDVISQINSLGYEATANIGEENYLNNDKYFNLTELIILSILGFFILYLYLTNMLMEKPAVPDYFNAKLNYLGFGISSFIISLPIFIVGFKFFIPGIKSLLHLKPTMESLISLGSMVAEIYSIVYLILSFGNYNSGTMLVMNTMFDSASMVLVLAYIGKYIEQINNNNLKNKLKELVKILPTNANVKRGEATQSVCVNALQVGDIVIVKQGETIPVDGIISFGSCKVDESSLTGEDRPVIKNELDEVLLGSIVLSGYIEISIVKLTKDTTLNNVLYLVSKSQSAKSKKDKIVNKITYYFVPFVIFTSLLVFIVWISITRDFNLSMRFFIAVITIACPCSIGLAIPLATANLSNVSIKNGILFRNTNSLEKFKRVTAFVFDKTGTLSNGNFVVDNIKFSKMLDAYPSIIYALEKTSNHPIARSICAYLNDNFKIKDLNIKVESKLNLGLAGIFEDKNYIIGNYKLFPNHPLNPKYLYFGTQNEIIGSIELHDNIAQGADQLITYLKDNQKQVYMLTGDNKSRAEIVADKLGIDSYYYEQNPQQKYHFIKDLQENGDVVCFVGDGINDAPALSASDVSISPKNSSGIASSQADISLTSENLSVIIDAFSIAKRTNTIINLNLIWAFSYNIVAMIIASGIFYPSFNIKLEPWMSALVMGISSISVIISSMFVLAYKSKRNVNI